MAHVCPGLSSIDAMSSTPEVPAQPDNSITEWLAEATNSDPLFLSSWSSTGAAVEGSEAQPVVVIQLGGTRADGGAASEFVFISWENAVALGQHLIDRAREIRQAAQGSES